MSEYVHIVYSAFQLHTALSYCLLCRAKTKAHCTAFLSFFFLYYNVVAQVLLLKLFLQFICKCQHLITE